MNIAKMIELLPSSVKHDLIDFKDGRLKVGNKTYDVTRMFVGHILTEEEKESLRKSKLILNIDGVWTHRYAPEIKGSYFDMKN